ncbi:hypothetical protein EHW99_0431 [Erwinia amylovora]|uniref:Uncharacterized protein n=2 Tax=Erwinia amylovora TaxID=552 RepID=A0A830ZYA9_ERWAM|nr:hypothetical protein EHX00_0431 [Erwinia amylovora]CBA23175.1 hypothetical protein predicted by Glimmer/Critica [Erwinia amylovora CFBP1430]CCO80044.1 hypothetical protein BN432_3273 [Erwinia amylovora Ea356]CCO83848.1 hypothetical protein BN433_3299 [Erwinia amylovora Ea266]CCO87610.1 hypothetical protein BN434_3249 [Erwinia amylovora CFBP 2585]CCO95196.1 hypothetical protein BN437_3294 [Erwinia amylovora NBRC 12687 = CFBP 1232]
MDAQHCKLNVHSSENSVFIFPASRRDHGYAYNAVLKR